LFCIEAVLAPSGGGCVDIIPDFQIVPLTADHMVVIRALPDVFACFPVDQPFQCRDGIWYRRHRRDRRPRRPAVFLHRYQQVHMVRHDHIHVNMKPRDVAGGKNVFFNDPARMGEIVFQQTVCFPWTKRRKGAALCPGVSSIASIDSLRPLWYTAYDL